MATCLHPRTNQTPEGLRCRICGAVVAADPAAAPIAPPVASRPPLRWKDSGIAASVGILLISLVHLVDAVVRQLAVLVHECGHALTAIAFGRPALPKFDLQYGGGITPSGPRMALLVILLVAAWGWALMRVWPLGIRRRLLVAACAALFPLAALCGLEEPLFAGAGHLAVFAIGAVFLGRALTGRAVAHQLELWLYAAIGAALWWQEAGFHLALITDPARMAWYQEGKGGMLPNDLVVLTESLGGSVTAWAWLMLLWGAACLAAMLLIVHRLGAVPVDGMPTPRRSP